MSGKMWLLVEWVDERNVFPSYGVVNADSLVNGDDDLHPGKLIFIRAKHGNSARKAQILRIDDDKRHVKEHKVLLERQDHQVKNVLSLCMRTIKEMKADPIYLTANTSQPNMTGAISGSSAMPPVVADFSNSPSDSDSDESQAELNNTSRHIHKSTKHVVQYKHVESPNNHNQIKQHRIRHTVVNKSILHEVAKQTLDQATQTEEDTLNLERIEQMEDILKKLNAQFLSLIERLHLTADRTSTSMEMSEAEHNDTESDKEQKEPTVEAPAENVQIEDGDRKPNTRALHVRRVSAHTTNNVEQIQSTSVDMVPIGLGNATVPARLLSEINWNSYTTATRQLLQAIFPRKVLATHSLTGKKSPAFANRAPKKCLDPKLIEDIVDTVVVRCRVPPRLVRTSITTKCTDEAKLYRNRLQGRQSRHQLNQSLANQENLPPSPLSSVGSHATD